MSSLTTTCLGVSNGSAALAITRAFRANRESMFAWRSSLLGRGTHSARDRAPLKRKERTRSVLACYPTSQLLQCGRSAGTDLAAYRHRLRNRYYVVSHGGAGRADERPQRQSQKQLPFRS